MAFSVTADPVKFDEAIAYFKKRHPSVDVDELQAWAEERAFTIAGVAELDVVAQVLDELEKSVTAGTPFADFKKAVAESLERAWEANDATPSNAGARIETIFRTNVQKSYNAGRWRQIRDPEIVKFRPFLMFDAVLDSRTTEVCAERDGTVLPADDPWWEANNPPLHFNCRASLRSLTEGEAERRGVDDAPPDAPETDDGFGSAPDDDTWEPSADDYPRELWNSYQAKTG